MMRRALPLAALLAGGAASAQYASPPPAIPSGVPTRQATPFMAQAGESDVFEISSSQLALRRSRDPRVRAYASMMIDHHTTTTNTLLARAKEAGLVPPPPVLSPGKTVMIAALHAAPAEAFDRSYLTQQVPSHEQALALHRTYADGGDVPSLRAAARAAVPLVQRHLNDARGMLGAM